MIQLPVYEKNQMTEQEWGEKAHENYMAILNVIHNVESSFLDLGELFWENLRFQYFKTNYETVDEFIESPEINVSRSSFFGLAHIHKYYRIDLGLSKEELIEIGRKKLTSMIGKINVDNKEEMLSKAKTLSARDLDLELKNHPVNSKTIEFKKIEKGYYRLVLVEDVEIEGDPLEVRKVEILKSNKGIIAYFGENIR